MILVPLGVASATPTATRHLSSLAVWREGSVFLFDCGEGAQMRMLQAGIKRSKIKYIFITHFDYDHFTGLIGLLSTLQLQRREQPLTLIGPKGLKEYVDWNFKFIGVELMFPVEFIEVEEDFEHQVVVDEEEFFIEARPLKHSRFCIGYRMQERDKPGKVDGVKAAELGITKDQDFKDLKAGKDIALEDGTLVLAADIVGEPIKGESFAYVTDTVYCENSVLLAKGVNILYHEATFSDALAEKAAENFHSTAKDAARVAKEAGVEHLIISHFSARYTNPFVLLREAKEDFENTWMATELRPVTTKHTVEKDIIVPKVMVREIADFEKEIAMIKSRLQREMTSKRRPSTNNNRGGGNYNRGGSRDSGSSGYDRGERSGGYDRSPSRDGGSGASYDRGARSGGYDRAPSRDGGGGGGYDRSPRDGGGSAGYDRRPAASGSYDRRPAPRDSGGGYDRRPQAPRDGGGGYDRSPRDGGRSGGYERRPAPSSGGSYDRSPREGGGSGGYDRGGRPGNYDRTPRSSGSGYSRDRDPNSSNDERPQSPRPITPRTPYDDFNRF